MDTNKHKCEQMIKTVL